jgi:hypothetical protein
MNRDIPSLLANIQTEAVTLESKAVDLTQSIQSFLNAASLLSAVAQHERDTAVAAVVTLQERVRVLEEIERRAIAQSEEVQRDWASPVEVEGMKRRIAQLESAAAWVPVAQRLPRADKNVIVKFKDRITEMEYTRMAHLRKYPSGEYDWMEPTNAYSYGGNVIEWVNIPGDSDNA